MEGWTFSGVHYVSVYAIFKSKMEWCYCKIWLTMSPLDAEISQYAQEHYKYLMFVLLVFNCRLGNVVTFVDDNAITNRAFAKITGPVFIFWYSYLVNLVSKKYVLVHESIIEKEKSLFRKFLSQLRLQNYEELLSFVQLSPTLHAGAQHIKCSDITWSWKTMPAIFVTTIWGLCFFWKMRKMIWSHSFEDLARLILWLYSYNQSLRHYVIHKRCSRVLQQSTWLWKTD